MLFGRPGSCGCPSRRRSSNYNYRTLQVPETTSLLAQLAGFLITGGEGEIRTHGTRKGSTVFETAAFDHSATSPDLANASILANARSSWRFADHAGFRISRGIRGWRSVNGSGSVLALAAALFSASESAD